MYHIQRHPGWLLALKQAIKIEDYHDFSFNNHSFISRISHSLNPVVDSLTTSHTETILSDRYQLGPLKTKYYDQIEHVPNKMSERINQVRELFSLVETKLNKGGALAFKMASALDSMVESATGEGINILPPSTKKQKKMRKEDTGNNSGLNHTKKEKPQDLAS